MSELTLFDTSGTSVAYISFEDEGTIYLWNGAPVAYLDDINIYGYNGKHLGWFEDGIIRDHTGQRVGFISSTCPVFTKFEPFKSFKQFRPFKSFQEFPPFKPFYSYDNSKINLETFLLFGRA